MTNFKNIKIIKRKVKKKTKHLRNHFLKIIADEVEKRLPKEQLGFFDDRFYDNKEDNEPGIAGKQDEIEKTDEIMDLPLTGVDIPLDMLDSLLEDGVSEEKIETDPSEITIVEISYKRSPELERRYSRRYEIMDVPEEAEVSFTYNDIATKAPVKIKYLNRKCELHFKEDSKKTVFVDPFEGAKKLTVLLERPNIYLKFIDDSEIIPCKIIAILDEKYSKIFEKFDDSIHRKIGNVLIFSKLTHAQQEFVMGKAEKLLNSTDDDSETFVPITGRTALRSSFEICKNGLSIGKRMIIERLFDEYELIHEQKSREDILTQIAYALNIDTDSREHKVLNYDEIISIFRKHIYGMDELIESIAEYILAYQYGGKSGFAILLVGNPGVGKSSVCESIAELFSCPLAFIDCSSTNYLGLNGTTKSYTAAEPGKIAKGLYNYGTTNLVMQLDEIEKLVKDRDGDAFHALIKPLGPQKCLEDKFLNYNIDVHATMFVATANHIENIPDYILDRFGNNVFYMNDYNENDKAEIGKRYLVPKLMKESGVREDDLAFSDEALQLVAKEYCDDHGARKMESYIRELVRKAIKLWSIGESTKPLMIDEEFVKNHLKNPKNTSNKIGFI